MKNLQFGRRSQGYTIIEFLIAGVLGLILLAGVGQLFLGSNDSFRMQRQLADLQDSGRFAVWHLKNDIERSGWRGAFQPINTLLFAENTFSAAGQCGGTDCTKNGTEPTQDSITLVFNGAMDCNGSAAKTDPSADIVPGDPGANKVVQNRYFVEDGVLFCQGNGGSAKQPLVDNVDAFQILYGIDVITHATPIDAKLECSDTAVDQYINNPTAKSQIAAVRFSLLVKGVENQNVPLIERAYQVNDREYKFTDRIIRRVFNLTVPIRNKQPNLSVDGTIPSCPIEPKVI